MNHLGGAGFATAILAFGAGGRSTRELETAAFFAVIAVVAVVVALLVFAIRRIVRSSRRRRSVGGNALMAAEVFVNPARQHTIDAIRRDDKQEHDSGEPPH